MAQFRLVQTSFWNDPKVEEDLTPEDKLFFLYILTNDQTTQTGIYQITRKNMAYGLGYSVETVNALLERFIHHLDLIKYNYETRELAIKNWGRYNLRRAGKPMLDCIRAELALIKDRSLISYVGNRVHHKAVQELYISASDMQEGEQTACTYTMMQADENIEREAEEDQMRKTDVEALFDHYLSKHIIQHKKMTTSMQRAIKARLRDYTVEELKQAIDNYADVYFSEQHWFTHKYPLADFMRDKDIRKFLDEADPINNFAYKKQEQKEEFDLS